MTKKSFSLTKLIFAIIMLTGISTIAQDTYIKGRWNLKLSGSPELTFNRKFRPAFLMGEVNYGLFNHIEAGIALGFENTKVPRINPNPSHPMDISTVYYLSPKYNVSINYHLMPYFAGERNPRFDVYLAGKLGGAYLESDLTYQNFFWNYYLGGGFGWYFTKHIGVYTEFGRQLPFKGKTNNKAGFRFGVAVKF